MDYIKKLEQMNACDESIAWLEEKNFESLQSAWDVCERGDWMLWLIGRTINRTDETQLRKITLAKARCAKLVVHLMKDERSKNAVVVAERFGLGNATRQELDAAAAAAAASSAYAYAYAAYAAAYADAAAADAASAYAYADAAYAYAAAYAAAAYAAAKNKTLKQCAGIVREIYQSAPELK